MAFREVLEEDRRARSGDNYSPVTFNHQSPWNHAENGEFQYSPEWCNDRYETSLPSESSHHDDPDAELQYWLRDADVNEERKKKEKQRGP